MNNQHNAEILVHDIGRAWLASQWGTSFTYEAATGRATRYIRLLRKSAIDGCLQGPIATQKACAQRCLTWQRPCVVQVYP